MIKQKGVQDVCQTSSEPIIIYLCLKWINFNIKLFMFICSFLFGYLLAKYFFSNGNMYDVVHLFLVVIFLTILQKSLMEKNLLKLKEWTIK